ncbi:MAG: DUF4292 domain-containing protein [Ferruginibacter sp.]
MNKIPFLFVFILSFFLIACHTTKKINSAIAPKDTVHISENHSVDDSILFANTIKETIRRNYIDFKTFSAKIKVDIEDSKGKQPDIIAVVRIVKDSAIWISISATFLNIEVFRVLITKDSVILLNKQKKEVQYRSLDYLQDVTEIPFDYKTLQDLFVGNPIFFNEENAVFRTQGNFILGSSVDEDFKNLLTFSIEKKLLLHSKLDDVNMSRNRTADVTYDEYTDINGKSFSTYRQIIASEKNKLDLRMNFKQFEFNKELSVSFSVPKNYKRK